ncbi:hypothetical protein AB0L62_12835 [Nocardia asteroides]|uniref:hypothetical protein n=1 Tax=Nocardia asteroides TaxID=1824 RepID=UPI0034258364
MNEVLVQTISTYPWVGAVLMLVIAACVALVVGAIVGICIMAAAHPNAERRRDARRATNPLVKVLRIAVDLVKAARRR